MKLTPLIILGIIVALWLTLATSFMAESARLKAVQTELIK